MRKNTAADPQLKLSGSIEVGRHQRTGISQHFHAHDGNLSNQIKPPSFLLIIAANVASP